MEVEIGSDILKLVSSALLYLQEPWETTGFVLKTSVSTSMASSLLTLMLSGYDPVLPSSMGNPGFFWTDIHYVKNEILILSRSPIMFLVWAPPTLSSTLLELASLGLGNSHSLFLIHPLGMYVLSSALSWLLPNYSSLNSWLEQLWFSEDYLGFLYLHTAGRKQRNKRDGLYNCEITGALNLGFQHPKGWE